MICLARSTTVGVRVFYPADPNGVVPGGVDTFIRGILKWAPPELNFSVVGMTTDKASRPVGRWIDCDLGRRTYRFFPAVAVADAGGRSRVPLSVQYTLGLRRFMSQVRTGFDVLDFHRIEPVLLFLRDTRPKNAFFHQDMGVIRSESKADILWRRFPAAYFWLESRVVRDLSSAWCVRESGAAALRQRNPGNAAAIRFVPTWVDTEVFMPPQGQGRERAREALAAEAGWTTSGVWVVTVGRLDSQKDPQLMLEAFARSVSQGHDLRWVIVGDGVLREPIQREIGRRGLNGRAYFAGLRSGVAISRILHACDVYALSSAYEGMPMALLEALASGLPVASTDVGEVARVVKPGVNGSLAEAGNLESFARALTDVVTGRHELQGEPACHSITDYTPAQVLRPVYENYLSLGRRSLVSVP